jgi:hypothetical protein
MLPSFCKDTVVRIRPATKESRGSTILDWENAKEETITGCSMQPASTTLSTDGRVLGIQDEYSLFTPPCADIAEGDRIRYDGKVYIVQGDVRVQPSAAYLHHKHITLRRYSG